MRKVVAFVAKSFLPEDVILVTEFDNFLKAFEQQGLSCIDASVGQEGSLSQKVMARLHEADAFIGILTRRHYVLQQGRARRRPLPFLQRTLSGLSPVEWATSGWILQESGYAVARKYKLILIAEKGVADIGQLHGDPVIVWFDRENVSECFAELTGQLLSLIREEPVPVPGEASQPGGGVEEPSHPESDSRNRAQPPPANMWERFIEFRAALRDSPPRLDDAEKAFADAIGLAGDDDDRDFISMTYLEARLLAGVWGAYEAFRNRLDDTPSMLGLAMLGRFVASTGEHEAALELFRRSLAAPAHGLNRTFPLREMSKSLSALGRGREAREQLVGELRTAGRTESEQAEVCVALADLAKRDAAGDDEASWLEHALSLKPDDHDARFRLAYLYSSNENEKMALFHYTKLANLHPSDMTFNNLGVALAHLDLPGLGVAAYKRASGMGNSLAMANRAQLLLNQGFLQEAEAVLDEGRAIADPHENVASVRAQIAVKERAEKEREASLLAEAEEERQFHALFGRARLEDTNSNDGLAGVWRTGWGEISV